MRDAGIPAPVQKLDPQDVIESIRQRHGYEIALLGRADAGEVGAAFVRLPDGRDCVLTLSGEPIDRIRVTASALDRARAAGLPVPTYDLLIDLSGRTAIFQQRLPGTPPTRVDDRLIAGMIDTVATFTNLMEDSLDVPILDLYLDRSGPGFCLHETLDAYSEETRSLLTAIRTIGRQTSTLAPGSDLVHADFHPGNVLTDADNVITGLVDWDGMCRGDRHFCLVTLLFDLGWGSHFSNRYATLGPDAESRILAQLAQLDRTVLQQYWAHMSLRLVDWSIRHHTPAEVNHYMAMARRVITF
ncbi:MAG: phosphotransferase [Thermomicrobiales bacterium]